MSARNKNLLVLAFSLALIVSALIYSPMAQATTYYVSTSGSDGNSGTISSAPWKTLTYVSSRTFTVGDEIKFKKGDTWDGTNAYDKYLRLHSNGSAYYNNWITVSSYGTASAKPKFINAQADYDTDLSGSGGYCYAAIVIKNDPGWKIMNLDIGNAEYGIVAYTSSTTRDGYWIEGCDIHDLSKTAPTTEAPYAIWFRPIYVGPADGFSNVTVLNCNVKNLVGNVAAWNRGGGVWIDCVDIFTVDGVDIFQTETYGIGVNACTNGTITNSKLNEAGYNTTAIYLAGNRYVTVQDSEISNIFLYDRDAMGIDLEGGNENVTIQRCYFYDIDNSGIMLFVAGGATQYNLYTTIKDNVFVNSARNGEYNWAGVYNPTALINSANYMGEVSGNIVYKTYADQMANLNHDNILPNPNFEDASVQWTLTGTASIDTGNWFWGGGHATLGNKCLKLPPNSSASVTVPSSCILQDGNSHDYVMKSSTEYTGSGTTGTLTLVMRDSADPPNTVGSPVQIQIDYNNDPGWPLVEVSALFTAPYNVDHFDVTFNNPAGTPTLYADCAIVARNESSVMTDAQPYSFTGTNINPYIPGSSFKGKADYDRNKSYHYPNDPAQGYRQWGYQSLSGSTYTPLNWDATNQAFADAGDGLFIGGDGCHPGGSKDAVTQWQAPYTGTVVAKGTVTLDASSGSNGVIARVKHNTTQKWSQTLTTSARTQDHNSLAEIRVNKDDYVRFEVNNNGNNSNDGTWWNPRVHYTEVSPNEYSSTSPAGGQMWNFASTQGWTGTNASVSASGGFLNATVTGASPKVTSPTLNDPNWIDTSVFRTVKVRMKNLTTATSAKLYWITDQTGEGTYDTNKCVTFPIKPSDTNIYREYSINVDRAALWVDNDLSKAARWRGNVKGLRIEIPGVSSGSFSLDYVKALPGNQWGFNVASDYEGWNTEIVDLTSYSVSGGILQATINGEDPHLTGSDVWFNASDYKYMKVRLKNSGLQSNPTLGITWWTDQGANNAESVAIDHTDYWTYVVPLHNNSDWKDIITQLKIDIDDSQAGGSGTIWIDSITLTNSLYDDRYLYLD